MQLKFVRLTSLAFSLAAFAVAGPGGHGGHGGGHGHGHGRCASCARSKSGKIKRSSEAKREFQRSHPCPSTGKTSGGCKGYVIDHVQPLASGGADDPSNMQWQTTSDAKEKDKTEHH